MQLLYNQKLDVRSLPQATLDEDTANLEKFNTLIQLWALSDQLLIPRLRNAAMRAMIIEKARQNNVLPTTSLHCVYKTTSHGSPIRRLFVRWCAAGDARMSDLHLTFPVVPKGNAD